MVDAIINEASKYTFKRIIAIGGGTIIDIAKVLAVTNGESVDKLYDKKDELKNITNLLLSLQLAVQAVKLQIFQLSTEQDWA